MAPQSRFGQGRKTAAKASSPSLPTRRLRRRRRNRPRRPARQRPTEAKGTEPQAPSPQPPLAALPASTAVAAWVKAKATEIKGVERARPLYHFEFWIEPPESIKGSVDAVTYEFNTPAVMPQMQVSRERETGFRISAGGLVCADNVRVTLRFRDGRAQTVDVDGCKLVS